MATIDPDLLARNVAGEWLQEQLVGDCIFFPVWVRKMLANQIRIQDSEKVAALKQFFARESEVCASVIEEHGTFRITHIAYTGENVMGEQVNGIDLWLWEKPSAQALRDRLEAVSRDLARFLEPILRSGQVYHVRDLGGSDGPYFFRTVELLQQASVPLENLRWTVIDQNELAITLGQARAIERKLSHIVSFVRASFMKPDSFPAPSEEADLVLAIGIVCSLPPKIAVGFLNGIRPHLKDGSRLLVPTLSDRCFQDDHQSYLVYRLIGWELWPKSEELVRWIFDTAGLKIDAIGSERPEGHYHLVWASV